MKVTLYGTAGCHLCEQAKALLSSLAVLHVDIADDDVLLERYGMRIPVLLRADTGEEIDWPFDAAGVLRFLS